MPTITVTVTASQATRVAVALGKVQNLMDEAKPPQPRSATAEEVRLWLIGRLKQLVIDVEGQEGEKQRGAYVVPAFDPS